MEFSIGFCSLTLPSVENQKPYTMTSAERWALFDTPLSNPKKGSLLYYCHYQHGRPPAVALSNHPARNDIQMS